MPISSPVQLKDASGGASPTGGGAWVRSIQQTQTLESPTYTVHYKGRAPNPLQQTQTLESSAGTNTGPALGEEGTADLTTKELYNAVLIVEPLIENT